MAGGLGLLQGVRGFRLFWAARTASYLGDFVGLTAVVLYVQGVGAGPWQVSAVLVARALPQALGPVTGALVDRLDARSVMVGCDLGRLVVVGGLAATLPPFPVLLALVAVSSTLSIFFLPAGKSTVPRLVPVERLGAANALLGIAHNVGMAAGPAAGAVLFARVGPAAAFAVDAASFGLSALLLAGVPQLAAGRRGSPVAGRRSLRVVVGDAVGDTREGLRYLVGHRTARALAVGLFVGVSLAGMDNVALVFLVREQFGAGGEVLGLALTVYGLARIVAPALLLAARPGNAGRLYLLGLGLSGVGLLLTGASPAVWLAVGCYAIAGVGNGLENVACDTLLGRTVAPDLLGRVFGAIYGPIFLAEALAAALGGLLLTVFSPAVTIMVAGAGLLLLTATVWRLLPQEQNAVTGRKSPKPPGDAESR